jgi:hypothetical protein
MASGDKRQARPEGVGSSLLVGVLEPAREECVKDIQAVVDKLPQDMDRGRALIEVICLRAFAAVMALGPGPRSLAVLDAFHKAWEKMAKADPNWAELLEYLRQRAERYRASLQQEHPNGHVYLIGARSRRCAGTYCTAR